MTPDNHNPQIGKYFGEVEELFIQNEIQHLNLFPIIKNRLSRYSERELWATPADGHPNEIVTEVYAEVVFKLLANNYFER